MQIAATAVERHTLEDHPLRLDTLVERAAARSPHAIAAIYRDEQLSYRELNGRANQIARALRRHGVGAKCFVGLCVQRSLASITALVGIAKSGAAFIPLDPASPDERLRTMIGDARPAILIIDDASRGRFTDEIGATVMTLGELLGEARKESDERPFCDESPRELAYVIYTSGSTGTPKGVMVEHRSVCNMLVSSIADFDLTPGDRVIQLAPLSFDPSIWQIFGTLAAGGSIVIPPAGTERDVDAIVREIRSHGVTVLITVPALLSLLIERDDLTESTSLRIAVSGGAQLTAALRDRFRARHLPLYNVYGPTEAAIHVTTHRCEGTDDRDFVPLGNPIANMHVYVLDESGNPVQSGDVGEIAIGGVGVARGYLNRSELTAERFVPDPFTASRGARLYRTGDLGRLHADGSIEFIGRTDDQVKLRGVRVELEEIVAALERHPSVVTAAVVVDDERVHAYVVARSNAGQLAAPLRAHVRTLLPSVAVPATFSVVDALPLLANGKVDRAALPLPTLPDASGNDIPAFHPLADIILSLWEELLGTRNIKMDANFFDLGGDSIMAASLIAKVEARLGRRVSLAVFFENPTIAGMIAAIVDEERATFESVITLRASGSRTPFFYLHGDIKGLGLYARRFGALLGDRPVYAIAPHGVGGSPIPPTVEAMAADHVRAILAVDPNGPYAIGGWCMAGIVTFEVARQLEKLGKHVAHISMIETEDSRTRLGRFVEKPLLRLASGLGIPESTKRALVGRLRSPARVLRDLLHPKHLTSVTAIQNRAVRLYTWEPINAPATIFCSEEEPNAKPDRIRSLWGDLFRSLEVDVIPGNHFSVIGRHVDDLTSGLANALDRAGI